MKGLKKDEPFFLNLCPNLVHGPVMTRDKKRLAHYCEKMGVPFPTDPGRIADMEPGQTLDIPRRHGLDKTLRA